MKTTIEVIGWTGAALILAAYALLSTGKLRAESVTYHLMNIPGGRRIRHQQRLERRAAVRGDECRVDRDRRVCPAATAQAPAQGGRAGVAGARNAASPQPCLIPGA